jgi:gliding motility-associated-like protein
MQANEGCASMSDGNGNLLFYTDGYNTFNRNHLLMPAGFGMVSFSTGSTSQGAVIVPVPGSTTQYYIFSLEYTAGNVAAPPVGRLCYSVVDMTMDGGLGDVLLAGVHMCANLGEKMIAVRGNSCNFWLLTHSKDSALFRAYEITPAGVNMTPVVSTVGSFTGVSSYSAGVMKISHDRTKLVVQCLRSVAGGARGTELYDFNPTTGVVSNCRVLENARGGYGAEFSPDNTKLYSTEFSGTMNTLSQFDISLPTTAAIVASRTVLSSMPINTNGLMGDMKLGKDNKIYRIADFTPPTINRNIDVITNPNAAGLSCGYTPNVIIVPAPTFLVYGLPNTIWLSKYDTTFDRHDTTGCFDGTGTAALASVYTGTGYLWDNGTTGATRTITSPGIYYVAIHSGCNVIIDTIYVHAGVATPPPTVTGRTVYCYGDTYIPPLATGASVQWYTSATGGVGTVAPPVIDTRVPGSTTLYAAEMAGCISTRTPFIITVLPEIVPSFAWNIRRSCNTDTVTFTNTSTNAVLYQWDFGDGSPSVIGADVVHVFDRHGTYNITLVAVNDEGCTRDTTIAVDLTYPYTANFIASPDTLCVGGTTTLTMTIPTAAISSWLWQKGDGITTYTLPSPTISYTAPGVYMAALTITDTAGCSDTVAHPICVISVQVSGMWDTTICVRDKLQLQNVVKATPDVGGDYRYQWENAKGLSDTAIQHPYFAGIGIYTYTFTATLQPWGCSDTGTIRISAISGRSITQVPSDMTINLGESVYLNAGNMLFYYWQPNDGSLNNANINNPIATPLATTRYTVYAYDQDGCLDSASVTVNVDSGVIECIPLAFTPNGDGLNDLFRPLCIRHQKIVAFMVYNRWGELLFTTDEVGNGWDGTYKGIAQELGVYYYQFIVARPDGRNITYKGDFTLLR